MINNTIEKAKDMVMQLGLSTEQLVGIQALLTELRSELLLLDAQVTECRARQDVYADVCQKMLDAIIQSTLRKYD